MSAETKGAKTIPFSTNSDGVNEKTAAVMSPKAMNPLQKYWPTWGGGDPYKPGLVEYDDDPRLVASRAAQRDRT